MENRCFERTAWISFFLHHSYFHFPMNSLKASVMIIHNSCRHWDVGGRVGIGSARSRQISGYKNLGLVFFIYAILQHKKKVAAGILVIMALKVIVPWVRLFQSGLINLGYMVDIVDIFYHLPGVSFYFSSVELVVCHTPCCFLFGSLVPP